MFVQELYTYNVRDGDYFVLDEKVRLKQLNKSSRVARSSCANSTGSSCGNSSSSNSCGSCSSEGESFSPAATPKGYMSLQARAGQLVTNFGGHSPTTAGDVSPSRRRERQSSGGSAGKGLPPRSPGPRTTAAKNLFCQSGNRRFGEFHHSKVFHDHETGN